ncbi:putative F-box/LRR-repeat protein at5g02930 [Phtheirospermum japonicum]|uniref:Putative F-box/LRR-repeat protein at5g02930 n=1 Tax=Phtheirospermum japonicum TaxID=374723 RepID=A0A830B5U8_9LAMI|nr:putative F-box/LRR-repeat protein at5g02930 [Phtheirospermum japonicum]
MRKTSIWEKDFGGGDEVREDEMKELGDDDDGELECSTENEVRGGEEFWEEESNSVENNGKTVSFSPSNKRAKEMLTDRLSALPDCLLIHILSYLGVKRAAITSVLSRRWQSLWAELPKLDFRESCTEKTCNLLSWVHRTLVLRTGNYLDELHISMSYDDCFASDVNTWVEFAVRNKVKQLHMELHARTGVFYTLPQVIYSCSSMTRLWLQRCIVAPEKSISWKHLTELEIQDVELHEHVIQKILSGGPVLSRLYLSGCWGFEHLDIDSQSLHYLTIEDRDDEHTGLFLEISAPYIRYLDISPFLIERKEVRITNVPSLIYADIQFHITDIGVSEEEMIDMINFFEDIKHVKELRVGCQCIQVLSKLAESGWQLPKSKRERLTVEAWRDGNGISGIVVLLESSPNLETLVIRCHDEYEEIDWGPLTRCDLACDLLRLKTVELTNYADPNIHGEPMLTMARILLQRATALEEMVVEAFGNLTEFPSVFLDISEELLNYPRSSQKAVVVLHP